MPSSSINVIKLCLSQLKNPTQKLDFMQRFPCDLESSLFAAIRDIRVKVFVEEQGCPLEEEMEFEEESHHFLFCLDRDDSVTIEGKAVACGRWRRTDYGFKIERMAVLKEFRALSIGKTLLKLVIEDIFLTQKAALSASNAPIHSLRIYLHSQSDKVAFYKAASYFSCIGEEFDECGINHYKMIYSPPSKIFY